MAYIPDDAIDASSQLKPAAFRLYCLICRRRNHKLGYALLNRTSISNTLRISRGQTWRAIDQLKTLKWITANEPYFVPLMGDFSPMDRWSITASDNERQARTRAPEERTNARLERTRALHSLKDLTSLSYQPFSTMPEAGDEKDDRCSCNNGLWTDPTTSQQISCMQCIAGATIRAAKFGEEF